MFKQLKLNGMVETDVL